MKQQKCPTKFLQTQFKMQEHKIQIPAVWLFFSDSQQVSISTCRAVDRCMIFSFRVLLVETFSSRAEWTGSEVNASLSTMS